MLTDFILNKERAVHGVGSRDLWQFDLEQEIVGNKQEKKYSASQGLLEIC